MHLHEKEGFKFDLETQRFIKNRWETEIGKKVREDIIDGIRNSVEIRAILDGYVLDHADNYDPYAHPIYPSGEMKEGAFWVFTQDDLRGMHFYNENFEGTNSLPKKALSYATFFNCNLREANLEMTDVSYARFERCNFQNSIFAMVGGFNARFSNCDLSGACFFDGFLGEFDFGGTDLRNSYWEKAKISEAIVDHRTRFDTSFRKEWNNRKMPETEVPDLLRSLRISYEKAEIWDTMDSFLAAEQKSRRRAILWPQFIEGKSVGSFRTWFWSLLMGVYSNYSTSPNRVILISLIIPILFAVFYMAAGAPFCSESFHKNLLGAVYYSFTTFTTLGFGDVTYTEIRPVLRIISTAEAFIGAISMSLFVVIVARKLFR